MTLSHFEAAQLNFSNRSEYNHTQDFDSIPKLPGVRVFIGKINQEKDSLWNHLWFHKDCWYNCNWGAETDNDISVVDDDRLTKWKNISQGTRGLHFCEHFDRHGGWFTWIQLPDETIFC